MNIWKSFREGFLGSFALAGAIVMAIVAAASAFLREDSAQHGDRKATHS